MGLILYLHIALFDMKSKLKKQTIKMRKRGMTYSEILKKVPVAKSTLSLWLRSVGLAKKQKQKITKKRIKASKKGGLKKKQIRIDKTEKIKKDARKDIKDLTKRDLWLMGIMLYWAEGSKQKEHSPSVGVEFANSDYRMIQLYLRWLINILKVPKSDITFRVYIHKNSKVKMKDVLKFWVKKTGFREKDFKSTYFKKHNLKTNRKNTKRNYYGMLQVRVRVSTDLNRKITGWIEAVHKHYCRIV